MDLVIWAAINCKPQKHPYWANRIYQTVVPIKEKEKKVTQKYIS